MKKRGTKLRKILLRTLLFLMLFIGLAAVVLRSKTVQTAISHKVSDWLSKELSAKVSIRALEYDFGRNLHIEGIFIADQKGDTMIASEVLDLVLDDYSSKNRIVKFTKADFVEANIQIGFHKNDKKQNIQFLVDYVNGQKRKPKHPEKSGVFISMEQH